MPPCEVLFLQSHGSIDTMHIARKIIVIEPHKKFSRDWGNSKFFYSSNFGGLPRRLGMKIIKYSI